MLRVNLNRLLSKLSYETDTLPLTVEYLAQQTGYHRNSITRLLKAPQENTTTGILDALLQVIFRQFRKVDLYKDSTDEALMELLLKEFITVTPETEGKGKSKRLEKKPARKAPATKARKQRKASSKS